MPLDLTNHRLNGAGSYFDQPDPALLPFGHFEAISSGGDAGQTVYRFVPNESSGLTQGGYVRGANGEDLVQLQEGNPYVIDPNQVQQNQQWGAVTNPSNLRDNSGMLDNLLPLLVAGGILGPTMVHAGLFGGGAGAGDIHPGMLQNFPEPTINPMDMNSFNSAMSGLGLNGGSGAAGGFTGMGEGMLDPETLSGAGGMGVAQNGIGPGAFMDQLQGALNNPSSLLSGNGLLANGASSLMSSLGGMGLTGLLRIAGLGTSLYGLLNGGGGGGGGGDGNGDNTNNGGGGGTLNITRGEYTPNPFTARQLANFRYAQPRGLLGGF